MDLRSLTLCAILAVFMLLACDKRVTDGDNPPDAAFDLAHSDPAAVELADSIMVAMGGRAAWNGIRFISWQPGAGRTIVWDKRNSRIRLELEADSMVALLDTRTGKGRVQTKAGEITQPDSLRKTLHYVRNLWHGDSLWLVLPFVLKGSGVTLRYLGEGTLATAQTKCNVLEVTLRAPAKDQYLLYVDVKDNLIKQWSWSRNAAQDKPEFVRPWDNYKRYGPILLSAERSDSSGPRNVRITDKVPAIVFTEF